MTIFPLVILFAVLTLRIIIYAANNNTEPGADRKTAIKNVF
jgi:hypothetical protein